MRNNGKSIWKITLSIFTILMILTLLSAGASASIKVYKTPLDATNPPGTQRLSCPCGQCCIDYTAVAASSTDPRVVKFVDQSKGKESFIRWDFGDGTSLQGTKITTSLKNPVHKFAKTGYYISCLSIKCSNCGKNMWVHKTIIIK
jgi:PKD repeat protein